MSFFKRLVPLKADMNINLQSIAVDEGQPFKGTATLDSKEKFSGEGVRMEIRVTEAWQEQAWERTRTGTSAR